MNDDDAGHLVRTGVRDGRGAGGGGDGGRRKRGAGVAVPGEAADAVVFEENKVRSSEIERRETAQNERKIREENTAFCATNSSNPHY